MKFFYIVKPEDTMLSICERFNIDPKKVIERNNIKENYQLKAGDCIEIPT